ncbi:hypothetical protein JCM11491_002633 [Sporobolomyces phaffii]
MRLQNAALEHPTRAIVLASVLLRLATSLAVLSVHALLPSFDASAARLDSPLAPSYEGFVRWDSVYFLAIARDGYSHEQRLAFFPGLPGALRIGAELARLLTRGPDLTFEAMVIAGIVLTTLATTGAAVLLYKMTLHLSQSPTHSLVTSFLFLLAPARAVLHAVPYTEPLSAFFTFAGMYSFVSRRHVRSSILFACGTLFRAQGAVLGLGFFGWRYMLEQPFRAGRFSFWKLATGTAITAALSLISASPFLAFQAYAHRLYCSQPASVRPWCSSASGFSYDWVQSHYWDVGPFRYWTVQQIPNFVLASPVLALSVSASYTFYTSHPRLVLSRTLPFLVSAPTPSRSNRRPFLNPVLIPFVHLHTATTLLLVVSSHVQIVLRLCIVNPVVWWYASDLLLAEETSGDGGQGWRTRKRWGETWVSYSIVWGTVSIALWALFLPPA